MRPRFTGIEEFCCTEMVFRSLLNVSPWRVRRGPNGDFGTLRWLFLSSLIEQE